MSVRNYISNARSQAAQQYNNWTGSPSFVNPRNGGYGNITGGVGSPNVQVGNANGAAPAAQSQPYIITISNASAAAVSAFDVLGAYTYINNAGFTNGSLTISGVTISSAISNVNY